MRYLKHYFEDIANIEIWPIISLLIFFFFFVSLSFYVFKMKKSHVKHMSAAPLDNDDLQGESYFQ